jgi:hypothetical protein
MLISKEHLEQFAHSNRNSRDRTMAPIDWHVSLVQKGARPMSPYPQVHVRLETMGEPLSTITMLIHEDSLEAVACKLDMLEHLIAHYGMTAFFGEADTEPPQHTT